MHDAGVLVVAGTDTSVTRVLLGVSSQAELMLLVEDGLTALQSLHAVTVNAAKMLRREAASSPRLEGGRRLRPSGLVTRAVTTSRTSPAALRENKSSDRPRRGVGLDARRRHSEGGGHPRMDV